MPTDDPLAGDNPPENSASPDDPGNDTPMPDAGKPEDNPEFQPAIADPAKPAPKKPNGKKPNPAKPNAAKPDATKPDKAQPPTGNDKPQPAQAKDKANAAEQREELAEREAKKLDQLQKADESLAADQRALDELLKEIGELLNAEMAEKGEGDSPMPGEPTSPEPPQSPPNGKPMPAQGQPMPAQGEPNDAAEQAPLSAEKAAELAQLLQSAKAQKAKQMAARLQAMQTGDADEQPNKGEKNPNAPPPPLKSSPKPRSGLEGDNSSQFAMEAVLKDLDPSTRSLILKMQPRVREELLQSLREEGPEGYQRFIRDYFKRLTKAGQNGK